MSRFGWSARWFAVILLTSAACGDATPPVGGGNVPSRVVITPSGLLAAVATPLPARWFYATREPAPAGASLPRSTLVFTIDQRPVTGTPPLLGRRWRRSCPGRHRLRVVSDPDASPCLATLFRSRCRCCNLRHMTDACSRDFGRDTTALQLGRRGKHGLARCHRQRALDARSLVVHQRNVRAARRGAGARLRLRAQPPRARSPGAHAAGSFRSRRAADSQEVQRECGEDSELPEPRGLRTAEHADYQRLRVTDYSHGPSRRNHLARDRRARPTNPLELYGCRLSTFGRRIRHPRCPVAGSPRAPLPTRRQGKVISFFTRAVTTPPPGAGSILRFVTPRFASPVAYVFLLSGSNEREMFHICPRPDAS